MTPTQTLARPEIPGPLNQLPGDPLAVAFQIFSLLYPAVSCLSLDSEGNGIVSVPEGVRQAAGRPDEFVLQRGEGLSGAGFLLLCEIEFIFPSKLYPDLSSLTPRLNPISSRTTATPADCQDIALNQINPGHIEFPGAVESTS